MSPAQSRPTSSNSTSMSHLSADLEARNSMAAVQLDELDRKIIGVLTEDARISNRQIASQLGVTEGTIRGRIKRLEQDNLIRFSAVTNLGYLGSPRVVLIGIQAQLSQVKTLTRKIAAMPEIGCVIATLGRFEI